MFIPGSMVTIYETHTEIKYPVPIQQYPALWQGINSKKAQFLGLSYNIGIRYYAHQIKLYYIWNYILCEGNGPGWIGTGNRDPGKTKYMEKIIDKKKGKHSAMHH